MALGKTLTLRELIARLFAQFSAAVDYFFPNHSSRSESHPPLGDISLDAELMIEAEEEEEAKNLSNGLDGLSPIDSQLKLTQRLSHIGRNRLWTQGFDRTKPKLSDLNPDIPWYA